MTFRGAGVKDLLEGKRRIHFIGIAGIGMSGLAKALKASGFSVSGSDIKEGKTLTDLRERGISVCAGHDEKNIQGADLVVRSTAITEDNPEFLAARKTGIPIAHRAELLAYFMNRENSIAILGTHGKTTTSALVSHLLTRLGFDPTCFVGGEMLNFRDNVILGKRNWMVAEVDESDGTHLLFSPSHAILTNLEEEHLDHYRGLVDIKKQFTAFLANLRSSSSVIYSMDCPNLREVVSSVPLRKISYGFSRDADFSAAEVDVKNEFLRSSYSLLRSGKKIADVRLNIPGAHNVHNSLAAIALLDSMGLSISQILDPLLEFRGAKRRLEVKWDEPGGTIVVDDYAHHPTEIRASLAALKLAGRRVTCVFQPHRYSRVRTMGHAFGSCFEEADRLILTEIYGAGEPNQVGVDSGVIYDAVLRSGHSCCLRMPKEEVGEYLLEHAAPSEIVAFLGAGDITEVADTFVEALKSESSGLKKVG